jgi:hypothetical protein
VNTQKGRVVYDRKVHFFNKKDVGRILKAVKERTTLEVFVTQVIDSLQETCRALNEDYVEAFKYSLFAFWDWIATGKNQATFTESRSRGTPFGTLEDLFYPANNETKELLIGYVAEMTNTIEDIKNFIEEEEL